MEEKLKQGGNKTQSWNTCYIKAEKGPSVEKMSHQAGTGT